MVPVPDRDLGNVRDLAHRGLGRLLVGQECSGVDRGRSEADRRLPGVDALLLGVLQQLARAEFRLVGEPEFGSEPGDVLLGVGGFDLQRELPRDVPVGPGDLALRDTGDLRNLVERAGDARHSRCGVDTRGGDALDGTAGQEVLVERAAVDDRRGLADVLREPERGGHAVDLAECLLEVALLRVSGPEPLVPLPEPLHLLALVRRQGVAVGVAVAPVDVGRQPLVVHRVRGGGADPGLLVLLLGVERTPFRPTIHGVLGDDEAAVSTDGLAVLVVGDDVPAALRTDQLLVCGLFVFLFGLLARANPPLAGRLAASTVVSLRFVSRARVHASVRALLAHQYTTNAPARGRKYGAGAVRTVSTEGEYKKGSESVSRIQHTARILAVYVERL